MLKLIVTNQPEVLPMEIHGVEIITPKTYFTNPTYINQKNTRVFNLCNDYRYQSKGYYVSLLAEARGHKPIPDVKNIQDIKSSSIVKSLTDDLNELIQKSLKKIVTNEFVLSVYFGQNIAAQYDKLSAELHRMFPVPLFRVRFVKTTIWQIQSIKTIGVKEILEHHRDFTKQAAINFFDKKRYSKAKNDISAFDLAILVQPDEMAAPSDKKALQKFKEIAEKNGFFVEFITKEDAYRLSEFDALFIRATTSVNHYTYKMARKAESEGLAVIDDPSSILKCANKVYLAELLKNAKIATPKTMIIHADNRKEVSQTLGLPCILKLPDSSFSQGVIKVSNEEELKSTLKRMLDQSELMIGQSYTPTDFDWRVGVLDGKALFACKYFMAKDHWQIYNWSSADKAEIEGNFQTMAIEDAPDYVIDIALKSTKLIGNGLYGVDIKEINGKAVIIEINDNPNIDHGVEDKVIGDKLYEEIIKWLKNKIVQRTQNEA